MPVPPILLQGDQRKRLRLALERAFPDFPVLRRFIQEGLGVNPNILYADAAALSERADALITWAQAAGRLDEVVEEALASAPGNPELRTFIGSIPTSHTESEWLSAERGRLDELKAYRERLTLRRDNAAADGDTALRDALSREIAMIERQLKRGPSLKKGEILGSGRDALMLRDVLGEGSYATVWQAYHRTLRAMVAVKVLHESAAHDPSRLERFRRGALELRRLNHPHVARVHQDDGEDRGFHYMVMDYYEKGDLGRAASRERPNDKRLSAKEALRLVIEAASGLAHIHEEGLVHRDVKPSNILIDHEHGARLADFDTVYRPDVAGDTHGPLGTQGYMSPEQLAGDASPTPADDIYALGMTAVFAVTGLSPPTTLAWRQAPTLDHVALPDGLKRVILRAVAPRARDRCASAEQLWADLLAEHAKLSDEDPLGVRHRIDAYELLMFACERGKVERPSDLWPIARDVPRSSTLVQAAIEAVRVCEFHGRSITRLVDDEWPGLSDAFMKHKASAPEAPNPVYLADLGEMLDTLLFLPASTLDEIVFRLGMERYIAPNAAVESIARDLLNRLDQEGRLDALAAAIGHTQVVPLRGGPVLPSTWQDAALLHVHARFFAERLARQAPVYTTSLLTSYVRERRYEEIASSAHEMWRALRASIPSYTRTEDLLVTFDHLTRIARRLTEPWPRPPTLSEAHKRLLRRAHLSIIDAFDLDLARTLMTSFIVPSWALPRIHVEGDERARVALRFLEAWSPTPLEALDQMLEDLAVPLDTPGLKELRGALQTGDLAACIRSLDSIEVGTVSLSRVADAVRSVVTMEQSACAPGEVEPPSIEEMIHWYDTGLFDDLCFVMGESTHTKKGTSMDRARALLRRHDSAEQRCALRASFDALVRARVERWRGEALIPPGAPSSAIDADPDRTSKTIFSTLADREDDAIERACDELGVPRRFIPGPEAPRTERSLQLQRYCAVFLRGTAALLDAASRLGIAIT